MIKQLADAKKANNNDYTFDILAIDSLTALEDVAKVLALELYKKTPLGAKWTGTDITTLPQGAGEGWLRTAFKSLFEAIRPYAKLGVIYTAHLKLGSIQIDGEELQAKDIALRGGNKLLATKDMDAIGFLYRDKSGKRINISFKNNNADLAVGTRCQHIANKEVMVSEMNSDGQVETHWDIIYPMLKKINNQ